MIKTKPLNDPSGNLDGWVINCPACKCWHLFDKRWEFNNNQESPTFTPSMLVNGSFSVEERKKYHLFKCHSFVTNGKIQYLDDCDHSLKNQTIDLGDPDA